jgi:hypothetical protein
MLDFIEDIHDSLFFGFQNTVGKMLVMGKSGIVMMGRIVISEYHSAILIDQMESIFQPSISLEILQKLQGRSINKEQPSPQHAFIRTEFAIVDLFIGNYLCIYIRSSTFLK